MILRILVLWLCLCDSSSKASCLVDEAGLCTPGVTVTEETQVDITEQDLGTEIVTTTTTTVTTTTETITNQRPDIKFILLTWATNELIIEKEDHSELSENIVEVMFTKTDAIERTGEIVAKYLSTNQGVMTEIRGFMDKINKDYRFRKEKAEYYNKLLLEKQQQLVREDISNNKSGKKE